MLNDEDADDLRGGEPDSWQNWDFEDVPDQELIACCMWEYARESRTIKMVSDHHWCSLRTIYFQKKYIEDPKLRERHDKEASLIEERLHHEGFEYGEFCDRFFGTDFPLLEIYNALTEYVRDGAEPWQILHPKLREILVGKIGKSLVLRPFRQSMLMELEELWESNASELLEIRSKEWPPEDEREEMHLYNESSPVEINLNKDGKPAEYVTAAFTIDFSRFTDTEVTTAFQDWLKISRPQRWKRPRRTLAVSPKKGRKQLDYRVALERLGLMRLLHWHSPLELRENYPAAWDKYGQKEPDFRREIRHACKFFRQLYPFLPPDELPESMERLGTWWPPMLKIAKKIDDEMRPPGAANRL
jgi:hypothetical protein